MASMVAFFRFVTCSFCWVVSFVCLDLLSYQVIKKNKIPLDDAAISNVIYFYKSDIVTNINYIFKHILFFNL